MAKCKYASRCFLAVLRLRYGAVLMVRYTRCRILAKGKKKMVVSWERYEKSRSVKRRYSDSAMSGTLRALLSYKNQQDILMHLEAQFKDPDRIRQLMQKNG